MPDPISSNQPETPQSPRPLGYAPASPRWSAARRWCRETFSREKIASGLKQMAWVVPLTVLIWIYAEREQRIPARDVRFFVQAVSSNPKVAVRLIEPADGVVSVDLLGPRNRIDELRAEIGSRSNPVVFEVPPERKEGEHQFSVTLATNRDPRFDGVSVSNSMPALITVFVDPIEEETVAVQVREEDAALFEQVVFNPPKVKVRIPRETRRAAMLANNGQLAVVADLGAAVLDRTPGRKSDITGVRLSVVGVDAGDVSIEPPTVSVSLSVRERAKSYKIPELPILEAVPNNLRETITVEMRPLVLFDVVVSGPPEVIDRIDREGSEGVRAQVSITAEDVGRGPKQKQVWFTLPEGAKVESYSPEGTVEVNVRRRTTTLSE